jgi:Tol biopolymer transport system component/Tfp pilus assembly protein PilF
MLAAWTQSQRQLAKTVSIRETGILSLARESFSKGDPVGALKSLQLILNSKHVGPDAQLLYAGILVEGGQPDEAISRLNDLLDERPEIAGAAYSLLARILLESDSSDSEKRKKTNEYHQKAKQLLPETAEAYFLQAMTALTIKEKLELLDKALSIDSHHYESYRLRALTYYASRKYEQMKDDAVAMVVLRSQDALGYSLRAIALRELGNYEDAIADYETAIGLTPVEDSHLVELYAQRSGIYLRMGQCEQAVADAKDGLALFPNETIFHFRVFCAQIALGNYGEASALYHRITDSDPVSRRKFSDWSMEYVFDTLDAGGSWHPADSEPHGIAFVPMVEAEETYQHVSTKAKRLITGAFNASWSPDGTRMVFSLGVPGYSGIAIFDPTSQEIDLLIAPGKDPKWSPDGQYIAFVRDCQALSLPELVTAELSSEFRAYRGEEIWVMNADGTAPRRLAQGRWPSWGRDSEYVYYQWVGYGPHRISIKDTNAESKLIARYGWDHCSVSPDGKYTAGADIGSMEIKDISSQSLVNEWTGPPRMWGGNWHPKGHEFSMAGTSNTEDRTGLWIYDLEKRQAQKVFSGQIASASWSPDGTELAFTLGKPFHEIWIADLDPNMSTTDALGPGRTLEEHYQEMTGHYTRMIKVNPGDAENYRRRAQYYDYLHDEEQVLADLDKYAAVLNSPEGQSAQDRWIPDLLVGLLRSVPKNLGLPVNSQYSERGGSISANGLTMFFSSDRPPGSGLADIWITTRTTVSDLWDTPRNLGSMINSPGKDTHPRISTDGLSLYFRSIRPGGFGRSDLWVASRASMSDRWGTPVNLGSTVNSSAHDSCPYISSDGLSLFFNSTRPGGYGSYDIWVTTRKSTHDEWGNPVNLGPIINSADLDGNPSISVDGRTLLFSSCRPGQYGWIDIWAARREAENGSWSEPVNLGPTINSRYGEHMPFISADGSTLHFLSNRPGGYGRGDLWQVPINPISESSQEDSDNSTQTTIHSDDGKEG